MPEIAELARQIAESAGPGEEVEAFVGWWHDTHARAYEGDVESFSSAESTGVGVRVVKEHRQGFAYVGAFDEAAAREALAEARDNASFATEDEHAGLASPDAVGPRELDIWRGTLESFPVERKTGIALDVERRLRACGPRIRQVVEADYEDSASELAVATSTGIRSFSRRTRCSASAEAIADDGDGSPQSAYSYSIAREPEQLDAEWVAVDSAERATRLLGATKPASASVAVVLDPRVTATLLSVLAQALSGEEAAKGRSLFAGRVGEAVAAPAITLVDDPTDAAAWGATTHDSEGLACRRVLLLDDGKLKGFLYDTRAARMAGTASTASAVRAGFKGVPGVGARALSLASGELGYDGVLQAVGEGLYVQSVSGVHSGVSHVSGDFSVGATGLMVRGGALAEPVREITIASTIQRMLQHVVAVGSDTFWGPASACGVTLAIAEMSMSGV